MSRMVGGAVWCLLSGRTGSDGVEMEESSSDSSLNSSSAKAVSNFMKEIFQLICSTPI
jgi:hypothetical protein